MLSIIPDQEEFWKKPEMCARWLTLKDQLGHLFTPVLQSWNY